MTKFARMCRLSAAVIGVGLLLFSPALRAQPAWKMAAPIPEAMGELVSVPMGGKIYVFSGLDTRPGPATHTPTGFVWAYDPASNDWTVRNKMPKPAHHVMAAPLGNHIYIFGGFTRPSMPGWQPTDASWEYDPAADSWKALPPMPTPRGAGQAVEVGGKIYVIGGVKSNKPESPDAPIPLGSTDQIVVGTVEMYDPAAAKWTTRAPMPTARNHYFAAAVDGKIYAVDGRIGTVFVTMSGVIDEVEEYDPSTDHWSYKGRSTIPRGDVNGVAYDGKLYVLGGEFQDTNRKMAFWTAEVFDPKTSLWSQLPHMQVARHGFAAALLGSQLHVMGGGFQSDGMPGVDPTTNTHEVIDLKP